MISRRFAILLLTLVLFVGVSTEPSWSGPPVPVVVAYGTLAAFTTEGAAQAHCPHDAVVWLNTRTGIWHERGMRWYGHTKEGAYVCRKDAAAAGYRDTRNGQ
jgi:hypothetical protein